MAQDANVTQPFALPAPRFAFLHHLKLAWRALLFDEDAYRAVHASERPFRHGAAILASMMLVVALARAFGYGLGVLTSLRLDVAQGAVYNLLTATTWYLQATAAQPQLAALFADLYPPLWQGMRILLGTPSWGQGLVLVLALLAVDALNWLLFGLAAHGLARWQESPGKLSAALGVLALSYAPYLLMVIMALPGAERGAGLLFLWMLAARFQAVKVLYGFSVMRALAIVLGAYLLFFVAGLGLLLLLIGAILL
jgi:hypothetical protein